MGGKSRAKTQDAGYILVRKSAVVTFGKCREIRRARIERRSSRAVSLSIGTMAGGAVLLVRHLAGRHVGWWKLCLAYDRLLIGSGADNNEQYTK